MSGSRIAALGRAAPRIFYGWVVVGGALVVMFVAYGAQYSFGVFFAALLDEFGWTRAQLAGAFSLYTFFYCVFAFPAGRLTDLWGPRVVIATGGICLGAALISMAFVTHLWQPYLIYGLVAALGQGTAYVPCNATVARWFVRRRGLAVGLVGIGHSLGTVVGPPLAQVLVQTVGWRTAYGVFGSTVLVVLVAVALVMRRDPAELGQHPDGERPERAGSGEGDGERDADGGGWTLGEAMRTRAFWILASAFVATWIPVFAPFVHMVRLCQDLGFPAMAGASVVGVMGVGALVGRPLMATLSDRVGRRLVIGASMVLQAAAYVGFVAVDGLTGLYVTGFIFGFSYGAVSTLFGAIVMDYFGRAHAGALVGVLFALAGSATALGPVAAGWLHDAVGSYTPAFVVAVALNVVAAVVLGFSRPPGLEPNRPSRAAR